MCVCVCVYVCVRVRVCVCVCACVCVLVYAKAEYKEIMKEDRRDIFSNFIINQLIKEEGKRKSLVTCFPRKKVIKRRIMKVNTPFESLFYDF